MLGGGLGGEAEGDDEVEQRGELRGRGRGRAVLPGGEHGRGDPYELGKPFKGRVGQGYRSLDVKIKSVIALDIYDIFD